MQPKLHIITPVKDSIDTTLRVIEKIFDSKSDFFWEYTIYNDYSTDETTEKLVDASRKYGFYLVNLKEITTHPSPNYLLVLQIAQQKALEDHADLLIIESDVLIEADTLQKIVDSTKSVKKAGLLAAITTDENGKINFPYLYAQNFKQGVVQTSKRLSFCCTLLTNEFLSTYSFSELNPEKSWFDVFISHKAVEIGFSNYLLTDVPVVHLPHSSRPWKQLKYTNPIKYYWRKLLNNKDKI